MRKIECADCGNVFDQKEMNATTNAVICDGCLVRRQDFHRQCEKRDGSIYIQQRAEK